MYLVYIYIFFLILNIEISWMAEQQEKINWADIEDDEEEH